MVIYITGIDGSGKSTIAKEIIDNIITEGETQLIWARYQPLIMKKIVFPFKNKFVSDKENDHLMNDDEFSRWILYKKKIVKNRFLSKIIFYIQSFDYYLQLIRVKKIISHSEQIILDRYLLDFIVDQSMNYGDISRSFITRNFINQLKKIDYIFFIDVDEHIAFSRKNDIPSMQYFQGKRDVYKSYISKLVNAYIIKNNSDINIALEEIKVVLNLNKVK